MEQRKLYVIAEEIQLHWHKPYFGAVPYLTALHSLSDLDDKVGLESAESIIVYFLGNAQSWRGPIAKRIKAELNQMLMKKPHQYK